MSTTTFANASHDFGAAGPGSRPGAIPGQQPVVPTQPSQAPTGPSEQPIHAPVNPDPKSHPIHPAVPTQPIHEGTDPSTPVTGDDRIR
jgi:hypothetical protein